MGDVIEIDPTKVGKIAQQVVSLLASENSETRRRAINAAMTLLGEQLSSPRNAKSLEASESDEAEEVQVAEFFNRDEILKPSDYAQLCAAFHFSLYGMAPFALEELRSIARDAGVVLPDRLDKTLTHAAKNGRKLFQSVGRSLFKPTSAAGLCFKERWDIRPGKRVKDT